MEKNNHKFIIVQGRLNDGSNTPVKAAMYSDYIAQSAFDNEVTLEEFKTALDQFSVNSVSSIEQINAWREEATNIFFDLLEKAGKLIRRPVEFLGGSDYEEVNGTTPDSENKN